MGASFRSLALSYPEQVRTNDYWHINYPEMVRAVVDKAALKVWSPPTNPGGGAPAMGPFLTEMAHYLTDPFRGTVERRILRDGETAFDLELSAARRALDAAALVAKDIDLLIVCSFLGDHVGVGNASFLAGALGMQGGAWNLETACAGGLAAFQVASALVSAGQARNVLVVTSCTYSRVAEDTDTLAWTVGDGAAAFVVGQTKTDRGILGVKTVNTAQTCGALYYEMYSNAAGTTSIRMKASDEAGRLIRQVSEECVQHCCRGAAQAAGITLDDIRYFVFNTPTAWYMKFCTRALGIDSERSIDTYPRYANVGPVLMPTNLYELARTKTLKPDDLVLLYSIGSVSSAGAVVMRWDEIALAPETTLATRSLAG